MKQKKVDGFEQEVTENVDANVLGIGGGISKTKTSIRISEYEAILHNLRTAAERIPEFPISDEILEKGGTIFKHLSNQGRRDLEFLNEYKKKGGKLNETEIVYPKGTDAKWVLPYLTTLIDEYNKKIQTETSNWVKNIPAVKYRPVGFRIVLSQYKGLMIYFLKKTNAIQFFTWDKSVNGNIKINNQNMDFLDKTHARVREDKDDYFWILVCGSEKQEFLTPERGKEEGILFAEEDLNYYRK